MEQVENLVRLALAPGIGCVTVNRLLRHFGDSDRVLGAAESELKGVEGVTANHVKGVLAAGKIDPRPELELAARHGVSLIAFDDPAYPAHLRSTYDPPFILYVRGELKPADNLSLALVGTRRASNYGHEQAERFGSLLARAGFTVVSGLARGIDSYAHRGALAARGRTLAVVGCGLAHMYPEENRDLAAEIAGHGAVISEFPMDVGPARENFPRRNRIIAGLSLGVLVVEAPERSGALITARFAGEMNREIFAIPGRIDQLNATGCHRLIREGATLVRNLEDILSELGPMSDAAAKAVSEQEKSKPAPVRGNSFSNIKPVDNEELILSRLDHEPVHIDEICAATGLPVSTVSATLMIMEIKQQVQQKPGKFFLRRGSAK
jgi:DNA processing protein